MVLTCCVPNCYTFQLKDKTLKFHRFPKSPVRKQKWIEAIFKNKDFEPLDSFLVCEKHFKQIDYIDSVNGSKVLSGTSVPTVYSQQTNSAEKNEKCDETISALDISEDAEIITKYNFQQMCRCCVMNKGEVNVFEAKFHNVFFADLINFCTNESVLSGDGLPRCICKDCEVQIMTCFKFINKVKDNQVQIRKLSQIFSTNQEQSYQVKLSDSQENINIASAENQTNRESKSNIALFKQKYKGLTEVYEQLCHIILQNRSQIKRRTKVNHKNNTIWLKDSAKRNKIEEEEKASILSIKAAEGISKELSFINENSECGSSDQHAETVYDNVNKLEGYVPISELTLNGDDTERNNNGHIKNEDDKKVSGTQCTDCSEVFSTEAGIIRHCRLTGHIMAYRFKCELCETTFRLRRNYKKHLQRHNGSKRICEVCGATIFSGNLRRHMEIHNDIKAHACQICGKTYATKGVLVIHIKNHYSSKDHKSLCSICGKSFRTLNLLNIHLNHKHVNDELGKKSYQCEMCYKFFVSEDSLKFHQKFSHADSPIRRHRYNKKNKVVATDQYRIVKQKKQCPICWKFVVLQEYKMHMLMHRDMKPFQCKVCNKQFRHNWQLDSHKKIHQM